MIAPEPTSAPLPRFLRPDEIETRPELQPRVALLTEVVEEYRDKYRSDASYPNGGMALPPLGIVVTAEGANLLWDGFHRHAAGRAAEITSFPVNAVHGNYELALRKSLGANANHGLRRTTEDKQRAVHKALEHWPELSNRAIADICQVTHAMVNGWRPVGAARVPASGIVVPPLADDVRANLRGSIKAVAMGARLARGPQRAEVEEPPTTPTRIIPGERKVGLERMATALEHYLDCGKDLAERHPEKLALLLLFATIEEAGDKAMLALGGGE